MSTAVDRQPSALPRLMRADEIAAEMGSDVVRERAQMDVATVEDDGGGVHALHDTIVTADGRRGLALASVCASREMRVLAEIARDIESHGDTPLLVYHRNALGQIDGVTVAWELIRQMHTTGPRYQVWRGHIHMFRVAGSLRLHFRVRSWRFWCVGLSLYAEGPVRDICLHIGVASFGVKWSQRTASA